MFVRVGADVREGVRGLQTVNREIDTMGRKTREASRQTTETGRHVTQAFRLMGAAAVAWGLSGAKQIESNNVAFKYLTGSAQNAHKMIKQLTDFAAHTPFELPQVEKGAQLLLNAGDAADSVVSHLTALGNAASVTTNPMDTFNRATLAISQSMGKGKLAGDDMRQMIEAGIPVWKLLSEATGKSTAELQKMSEQGQLLTATYLPKLYNQMQKDYGGAMVEQSKTLDGVMSTLKDTTSIFLSGALQPLLPALKTGAQFMADNMRVVGPLAAGVLVLGAAGMTVSKAMKVWKDVQVGLNTVTGFFNGLVVTETGELTANTGATVANTVAKEANATAARGATVATAAWGTAAAGAGASMSVAAGPVAALIALNVAAGYGLEKLTERFGRLQGAAMALGGPMAFLVGSGIKVGKSITDLIGLTGKHKQVTDADAAAMAGLKAQADVLGVSENQLTGKTVQQGQAIVDNAKKIKTLGEHLKDLKDEYATAFNSIEQSLIAYQGSLTDSKNSSYVTTKDVVKDLHQQVRNFQTYSSDVHRLIKAGVNPAAIQELSTKGPQYVHALAKGSATQLQDYKATWNARNKEIKGDFATAMDQQYAKLKKSIEDMKNKINTLSGKTIYITAKTQVEVSKSVAQYLAASNIPGFHQKGTRIPGYGGGDIYPMYGEPGEAVVPKELVKRPEFQAWAGAHGIPGFQFGGIVGNYYKPTIAETRKIGISEGMVASAVMHQLGLGMVGGFGGGAASGNVIALALAQARKMAASYKVALALMEAGIVESGLRNLNYGDRDSLGFLQQRPSQGWLHPMDISYASWDFLRRAIPIQGKYGTAGALAQAVQRSAFPGRYNQVQAQAMGILSAAGWAGNGLDAIFTKPTLIGVGDKGAERVRVEPLGGRSGGGTFTIEKGAIQLNMPIIGGLTPHMRFEVERIAEAVGDKVGQQILRAIDRRGSGH